MDRKETEATNAEVTERAEPAKPFRARLLETVGITLITWLQRFTLLTSRVVYLNRETVDRLLKENRPFIFGIWHCNVYMSPILYRGMNMHVMISKSRDGELIARVVHAFKNKSIRGSTSRGGPSALKAMIRVARQNGRLAFTPDGPRGPALQAQMGIIAAASACGIPIVPAHYESTRQKVAKSWDSHRVPLPFGTIINSFGDPIDIPREMNEEQSEEFRLLVETKLLENMKRAEDARDRLMKGEKL